MEVTSEVSLLVEPLVMVVQVEQALVTTVSVVEECWSIVVELIVASVGYVTSIGSQAPNYAAHSVFVMH